LEFILIHINDIRDLNRGTDWYRGQVPQALKGTGAKIFDWDPKEFGDWVEDSYQTGRNPTPKPKSFLETFNEFLD